MIRLRGNLATVIFGVLLVATTRKLTSAEYQDKGAMANKDCITADYLARSCQNLYVKADRLELPHFCGAAEQFLVVYKEKRCYCNWLKNQPLFQKLADRFGLQTTPYDFYETMQIVVPRFRKFYGDYLDLCAKQGWNNLATCPEA